MSEALSLAVEALVPLRHKAVNGWLVKFPGLRCEPVPHVLIDVVVQGESFAPSEPFSGTKNGVIAGARSELYGRWPRTYHCIDHQQRYPREGNEFLARMVAGDKFMCHHFEPELIWQNLQWKHPGSPPPIHTSAVKFMVTFFFDQDGPLLIDFLQRGITVNAQRYSQILTTLRQAIKSKRLGKLTRGVILLHDNVKPHAANTIPAFLQKLKWEVLGHPTYSPDLSPCDYTIFGPIRKALRGKRFTSDDDVKQYVRNWFTTQPQEFY